MATKKAAKPKKPATKPKTAPKKPAPRRVQRQHRVSREDVFCKEYLVDLNGYKAALRAGYSALSARQTASELLAKPKVQAKIQKAMDARAERTGIEADEVLRRLWAIATADPRELVELHRGCCRFCWGAGNRYQYTRHELETAQQEHEAKMQLRPENERVPFNDAGGIGYDPRNDPNPDCQECFGEGQLRELAKDTRDLSPEARLLFAGLKPTQNGLEVKMHDQTAMLVNVGKHLGMFAKNVNLKGDVKHRHEGLSDVLDEIDGSETGLPGHDGTG